jgi:SAM-dependent methyltransferase
MGNEHHALQLMAENYMKRSHEYWNERSAHYDSPAPDVFGRNITASFLRKLHPKSLVEVGCGTGQLFPLYKDIPHVVGADWTDGMLAQSRKRLDRHDYGNIELKKLNIITEALPEHFDVALTRTVLMHISEENIENACKHLTEMADTLLLFEFYDPNAARLEWHNFHHEYPLILRKFGFEISEAYSRPDGMPQILFVFKKKA